MPRNELVIGHAPVPGSVFGGWLKLESPYHKEFVADLNKLLSHDRRWVPHERVWYVWSTHKWDMVWLGSLYFDRVIDNAESFGKQPPPGWMPSDLLWTKRDLPCLGCGKPTTHLSKEGRELGIFEKAAGTKKNRLLLCKNKHCGAMFSIEEWFQTWMAPEKADAS